MLGYFVAFISSCFNRKIMQVLSTANKNVFISCIDPSIQVSVSIFASYILVSRSCNIWHSQPVYLLHIRGLFSESKPSELFLLIARYAWQAPSRVYIVHLCVYLTGVSFNYLEYLIVTLVLSHTLILFWNVWCPIQAQLVLKSRRQHHFHAAVLVFALVLPCILCAGVILGHLLDAVYYAVSVPFNAICGMLTTAIGVIVWKLLWLNVNTRHV